MSRVVVKIVALLGLVNSLVACTAEESSSGVSALTTGQRIGEVAAKAQEVYIYYANESRPLPEEQKNIDYIVGLMKQVDDSDVRDAAEKLRRDGQEFSAAVDQDVLEMESIFCKASSNKRVALIVFTNKLVREGKYSYCKAGQELKTVNSADLAREYAKSDYQGDFRLKSSPLANKTMLVNALKITRSRFPVNTHSYSLVTKSHGSEKNAISVRLSTRGEYIKSQEDGENRFKSALKAVAEAKRKKQIASLQDRIKMQTKVLEALRSMPKDDERDRILTDQEDLGRKFAGVKGEDLEGFLKDVYLKDFLMKDYVMKDYVMKDGVLKDGVMKDGIMKDGVLKDYVMKDGELKDFVMKDGLMKDFVMKDGLLSGEKTENGDDDILEKAGLPGIGMTKVDWLEAVAMDGEDDRMSFNLVFAESCQSYLEWDVLIDIAESGWKTNIGTLFVSDERGIDTYRTINYTAAVGRMNLSKPFAPQLIDYLNKVANSSGL